MANDVKALERLQVTGTGVTVLPKNFDALSVRNQKKLMIEAFRDNLIALNDVITSGERLKSDVANITQLIKGSKEGKELARKKKELSELKKQHDDITSGRAWMLRMAAKMGIDIRSELKNMKMIEQ